MARRRGTRPGGVRRRTVVLRARLADQWQSTWDLLLVRLDALRMSGLLVLQAVVAAGGTWSLVGRIDGRSTVFAPAVAVIIVAVAQTQRLRRTVELILGVALGVALGDTLTLVAGTGVWQIMLGVAVAMVAAILLGGGPGFVVQAAVSAIIILAVPVSGGGFYVRIVDAAVGGAVGLLVFALLLPVNPMSVVRRVAPRALDDLAETLHELAEALRDRSQAGLRAATERTHAVQEPLRVLTDALAAASETARIAPLRWRARSSLRPFWALTDQLDHVMRNLRVLTRRSRALLGQGERVPPGLVEGLDRVSGAVRLLLDDLIAERDPQRARAELVRGVRATADVPVGLSISAQVVVGQLRSTAVDLLRACGLSYREADEMVRRAVTEPRLRPDPAG